MIAAWMASKFAPWIAGAALLGLLVGGLQVRHYHDISQGEAKESARRDLMDAKNTAAAQSALLAENGKTRAAQATLAIVQADNQRLQQENDREKATSKQRNAALLAGTERMRIELAGARNPAQTGSASGATTVTVDQGASFDADIAPAVAAGLDAIREAHNEAVRRLGACIKEYDALYNAVNAK